MSAALQQREGREKLKPELPKPEFGSSKNGCASSPSHDHGCLVGASLFFSLAASCFTEPGFQHVWGEGQHYSLPYYHCRCNHLGPEFDCSPSVGSTILAPCSSRILAPTSDLPTPS
ncbi:uncharacterized protein LOC144167350 [Haemaphysalis longicornis]